MGVLILVLIVLAPYPSLNVSSIIECDIPGTTDSLVPHYSVWEFLSLRKFYFRTNSPQPAIESAFRKEEAKPCDALSSTSIFAAPTAIWPCRSRPRWTPKSSTARSTCSASWTGWHIFLTAPYDGTRGRTNGRARRREMGVPYML